MEVNTTRRTDHSARYQLSVGPFLARQLSRRPTSGFSFSSGEGAPNVLSSLWASFVGPQGYRLLTPRLSLPKSNLPVFLSYPHNALCLLQPSVGAPLVSFGVGLGGAAPSYLFRAPTSVSHLFHAQGLRSRLSFLVGLQRAPDPLFLVSIQSSVGASRPASLWLFRPNIFSQDSIHGGVGLALGSALNPAPLSLSSFYHFLVSFAPGALGVSLLKVGFWGSLTGQPPFPGVLSLPKFFGLCSLIRSLSDHWVLGGALQRDLYTAIPSDVRTVRRLRASKAVCLPSDVPLHIVCGSKDVIHSWAIPGLCVKIDCIPGFSSHRRLTLRWRGAFWGQCMEVCGRYHHWMPILVQVTHRDLFLS